ncbi:MAG: peptidase [Verrucomicrobia bacterium]|nr:peptidase [Verrucomicrobiota bacterium]
MTPSFPAPPPASLDALLARMISINSVNPHFGGPAGGEESLAADLEKVAQGWGLQTRRGAAKAGGGPRNLIVTCEPVPGGEWILFESHLDTVSVPGMTVAPFGGKIEGGRIHGRGACDTKGSGAAMLWALREYARDARRPRNAALIFAVDEEARMTGAQAFAANELKEFLPRLRGMIVGEPTLLRPVVAHNGVIRWRTLTRGRAAHSADPAKGLSAISAMMRVVETMESRYVPLVKGSHPLTGMAALSVNMIRGGTAVNVIPAECEIEVDRRTVPGETAEQVLRERDAILAGHAVEHDTLYVVPAMDAALGRGFHEWMSPVLKRHGCDATPRGAPYVTDASHYAAAGAPTIVFGPGDLAQAHTKDEWLALDQLKTASAVYLDLLRAPA